VPCDTCGARQTDPVRGASPWKRGVRQGLQVLVCPDCQVAGDWTADLDRCKSCGSTALVRTLGETHCRSCGAVATASVPSEAPPPTTTAPGLSEDVAAALDRLWPGR